MKAFEEYIFEIAEQSVHGYSDSVLFCNHSFHEYFLKNIGKITISFTSKQAAIFDPVLFGVHSFHIIFHNKSILI